jgi:hypothetical protein
MEMRIVEQISPLGDVRYVPQKLVNVPGFWPWSSKLVWQGFDSDNHLNFPRKFIFLSDAKAFIHAQMQSQHVQRATVERVALSRRVMVERVAWYSSEE